jgi:hypothetical protein
MAFIADGTTTVAEVINLQTDFLLNGLYAERKPLKGVRQIDIQRNAAARHAIEKLREHLLEVWCADGNTRFADVAVPTGKAFLKEVQS